METCNSRSGHREMKRAPSTKGTEPRVIVNHHRGCSLRIVSFEMSLAATSCNIGVNRKKLSRLTSVMVTLGSRASVLSS